MFLYFALKYCTNEHVYFNQLTAQAAVTEQSQYTAVKKHEGMGFYGSYQRLSSEQISRVLHAEAKIISHTREFPSSGELGLTKTTTEPCAFFSFLLFLGGGQRECRGSLGGGGVRCQAHTFQGSIKCPQCMAAAAGCPVKRAGLMSGVP